MAIIINKSAVSQQKVSVYRQFELTTLLNLNEASCHWIYYLLQHQPSAPIAQQSQVPTSIEARNIGRVYIKPAAYSVFWPWQGADDSFILLIPSDFLSHLAISSRCLASCQIELLPVVDRQDTTLDRMFFLLSRELETVQPGSQTYLDSFTYVLGLHLLRYYCAVSRRT